MANSAFSFIKEGQWVKLQVRTKSDKRGRGGSIGRRGGERSMAGVSQMGRVRNEIVRQRANVEV